MEQINNIKKNFENGIKEPATLYTMAKSDYKRFLKQMETSDMKNGYTRYLAELSFLNRMLKLAREEGRSTEIININEKINQVNENLEKFGIKVK